MGWAVTRVGLASPVALAMRRVADEDGQRLGGRERGMHDEVLSGKKIDAGGRGDQRVGCDAEREQDGAVELDALDAKFVLQVELLVGVEKTWSGRRRAGNRAG